jgi:hypothetical protein
MHVAAGLDEFLLPLWEYVASFVVPIHEGVGSMTLESVFLDMPMELAVEDREDGRRLLAAPPTQHLTTSVMPAFHRIRVRLEPA